jgi:hypothetical protein
MSDLAIYHVKRARYDLEDPWYRPDDVAPVPLVRSDDGSQARLTSEFAIYYDDAKLYVLFHCDDDHVVATHLEHDAPLWEEDAVEIFLGVDGLTKYFELQVNPLGTTYDAVVDSPDGRRETMNVDPSWTCNGLRPAIRRIAEGSVINVETLVAIEFASLGVEAPEPGTQWRANLFRIDRSPAGDEFLAWSPTGRKPADFHVPEKFGILEFL